MWLVRGETIYLTVLLTNEDKEEECVVTSSLLQGCAFKLVHWNCWDDIKTEMRIITAIRYITAGIKEDNTDKSSLSPVTRKDIDTVSYHPDDEKHYPSNYKRWRFHVGTPAAAYIEMRNDIRGNISAESYYNFM
mmetsp:Transcript_19498/g.24109  ORF Transcript_19498/g.24109 Transcript_19498/m.24109 type:complete len:134 (-) Transcript_19498:22-423(-)